METSSYMQGCSHLYARRAVNTNAYGCLQCGRWESAYQARIDGTINRWEAACVAERRRSSVVVKSPEEAEFLRREAQARQSTEKYMIPDDVRVKAVIQAYKDAVRDFAQSNAALKQGLENAKLALEEKDRELAALRAGASASAEEGRVAPGGAERGSLQWAGHVAECGGLGSQRMDSRRDLDWRLRP